MNASASYHSFYRRTAWLSSLLAVFCLCAELDTCSKDFSGEGCEQVDLGQALEIIEQNDDPKGIFGALLKVFGGLCGEQTLYQDIVELGDDEELASILGSGMSNKMRDILIEHVKTCRSRSSSGKAVVWWLKIKAAMRWGIFIRKKAAERRAQIIELEDE
ncbi:hypothetical protein KSP40_PGU014329 [Platanthera guangdongensis]|uniref:Secreted protein n=1 Tax=Platanthera guangdongensis TaxID=2320717 RepID=A0ABR2LXG2_9ASPA